jgi:hypothetical protein
MGAFGELLIQHWGGDLDKYHGNHTNSKKEPQEISEQEQKNQQLKYQYNYKIQSARKMLLGLTSDIMYQSDIVNHITETSLKNGFSNYDKNIQNLMWKEYNIFINKYVKRK